MKIFSREQVEENIIYHDQGKLKEVDTHQLLKKEDEVEQITSFDEVRAIGTWFLKQKFNSVIPSSKPLPEKLLQKHILNGNQAFLARLALGSDLESQFPVTVEVITTPVGKELRLHIVPIHFGALEVAQYGRHTDSLLALAAAAAVAPQFILALEGGIKTTVCSSKKEIVTGITPDHGTPLAVTFDAFKHASKTLDKAVSVTGNHQLNIKQAAHLHGRSVMQSGQIASAAADSKIAAGVSLHTVLRSELPRHALFIPTISDPISGEKTILSMSESLFQEGFSNQDMSFLAAALGFTAEVVGETDREKTVEKVLSPKFAETPLRELVN